MADDLRRIAVESSRSGLLLGQEMLRPRSIPERESGMFLADYMRDWATSRHKFAEDPFEGDEELREEAMRYVAKLKAQHDLAAWMWRHEEREVEHAGLIDGKTIRFPIEDNPVEDGLPSRYEVVPERSPVGAPAAHTEELDRIAARNAQRTLKTAKQRLMAHPDAKLRDAIEVLHRSAEQPDLWPDIRTFIESAGPAGEHTHEWF